MAKDSTSNAAGAKGWRMELPVWDGKAESLEEYAGAVELLVLGTKVKTGSSSALSSWRHCHMDRVSGSWL